MIYCSSQDDLHCEPQSDTHFIHSLIIFFNYVVVKILFNVIKILGSISFVGDGDWGGLKLFANLLLFLFGAITTVVLSNYSYPMLWIIPWSILRIIWYQGLSLGLLYAKHLFNSLIYLPYAKDSYCTNHCNKCVKNILSTG